MPEGGSNSQTCVAEPPNLMPFRSARLSLDTKHPKRTPNYSVPSGTPQERTRKSTFLSSGSQMRE